MTCSLISPTTLSVVNYLGFGGVRGEVFPCQHCKKQVARRQGRGLHWHHHSVHGGRAVRRAGVGWVVVGEGGESSDSSSAAVFPQLFRDVQQGFPLSSFLFNEYSPYRLVLL